MIVHIIEFQVYLSFRLAITALQYL